MKVRRIHLIDIENLTGVSAPTPRDACWAAESYRRATQVEAGDHIIVAASHHNAFSALAAFPGARLLLGSGPDGADLRLLEVMAEESIETRFGTLVIGSGDGIFSTEAARLSLSMHVTAVGLLGHVSARLKLASHLTHYMGDTQRRDYREAA